MKITRHVVAGAALALIGTGALAGELAIHPFASTENHCPEGLQPVVFDGLISCGTPTTSQSYQSVMAHSVKQHRTRAHRVRATRTGVGTCPEGVKGCY